MPFKKILTLLLIAIALLFIVQNLNFVETRFLFWSFSLPHALLLLIGLAAGLLIGWLWRANLLHRRKED